MENLGSWLTRGLFIWFIIIPAFVFLLCVRRMNGKWHIKKDGIAPYLYDPYSSKAMRTPPKNMCQLYLDVIVTEIATIDLLCATVLFGGILGGMIYLLISTAIEHPKTFLALLLGIKFIIAITWKAQVYAKTEAWQRRKKKIKSQINKTSQAFQKAKHKTSSKICIKFENI